MSVHPFSKVTIINPEGKKDILLIHGLGANSQSWKYQMDTLLFLKYRILLVDLSRTYINNTGINVLDDEVQHILKYIDDNHISKIDIMGMSLGSILAMKISYQRPDLVKKAVFISPFAHITPTFRLKLRLLIARIMPLNLTCKFVADGLFKRKADQKDFSCSCSSYDKKQYISYLDELKLLDIRDDIKNIKAKSLVLIGKQDGTVPIENQIQVAELIPKSEKSLIDGNHALVVNNNKTVNFILKDWLEP
ncbi:alpha/beta hydrolase [Rickettsiaceae bacterium]|nr:alpha/beta hydrolase [Rickettsiaceae bacterium]